MSECTSEKCQCAICSRNYKKPEPVAEVERFENIHEVPFGESLLVVLERLTSARLVHPVSLHVPETFFFKNSKVHSYYYSNSVANAVDAERRAVLISRTRTTEESGNCHNGKLDTRPHLLVDAR